MAALIAPVLIIALFTRGARSICLLQLRYNESISFLPDCTAR